MRMTLFTTVFEICQKTFENLPAADAFGTFPTPEHNPDVLAQDITALLESRRLKNGMWSYGANGHAALEPTSFAYMALRSDIEYAGGLAPEPLLRRQRSDGSWPAFDGDVEPSWATALAVCALTTYDTALPARSKAIGWLLRNRGKEADWPWRWKFRWVEREAPIDPARFGWPWMPETASWVVPTSFSVLVLKQWLTCQTDVEAKARVETGVSMLIERCCSDGGWNAGNKMVFGSALPSHIEPTAVALLALQGASGSFTNPGLEWLARSATGQVSVMAQSWSVLSLFVYGWNVNNLKSALATRLRQTAETQDNVSLALAILALRAGEVIHPFEVIA
jgi:hypothetical protein